MRGHLTSLCALVATFLLIAGLAAAQGTPPPDPTTQQGALALFDWLYQAAQQHDRMAVVAGILVGITALVRWLAPKLHGKIGDAVNGPIGKPLTVLAIAEIGAITTALIAHKLDARTLLTGLVMAFFAAGGYSTIKPLLDRLFGNSTAAKAATVILVFGALGLGSSGCACWQKASADYNTPKCVVSRATVDCTVSAVEQLAPVAIAALESFFGQAATIDWGKIEGALEQVGIRDGSCLLARLEQWIVTKIGALQQVAAVPGGPTLARAQVHYDEFKAMRARYLAKHGLGANLTYHFANGDVHP